jgi:hypothetical protein
MLKIFLPLHISIFKTTSKIFLKFPEEKDITDIDNFVTVKSLTPLNMDHYLFIGTVNRNSQILKSV